MKGKKEHTLKDPWAPLHGSTSSQDNALFAAQHFYPERRIVIIEGWRSFAPVVSRSEQKRLTHLGLQPAVIWSPAVVLDTANEIKHGDWLISSWIRSTKGVMVASSGSGQQAVGLIDTLEAILVVMQPAPKDEAAALPSDQAVEHLGVVERWQNWRTPNF